MGKSITEHNDIASKLTSYSIRVFQKPNSMHEHGKWGPVGSVVPFKILRQQIIGFLFIGRRIAAVNHVAWRTT